jgi:hypothetical protein
MSQTAQKSDGSGAKSQVSTGGTHAKPGKAELGSVRGKSLKRTRLRETQASHFTIKQRSRREICSELYVQTQDANFTCDLDSGLRPSLPMLLLSNIAALVPLKTAHDKVRKKCSASTARRREYFIGVEEVTLRRALEVGDPTPGQELPMRLWKAPRS